MFKKKKDQSTSRKILSKEIPKWRYKLVGKCHRETIWWNLW